MCSKLADCAETKRRLWAQIEFISARLDEKCTKQRGNRFLSFSLFLFFFFYQEPLFHLKNQPFAFRLLRLLILSAAAEAEELSLICLLARRISTGERRSIMQHGCRIVERCAVSNLHVLFIAVSCFFFIQFRSQIGEVSW